MKQVLIITCLGVSVCEVVRTVYEDDPVLRSHLQQEGPGWRPLPYEPEGSHQSRKEKNEFPFQRVGSRDGMEWKFLIIFHLFYFDGFPECVEEEPRLTGNYCHRLLTKGSHQSRKNEKYEMNENFPQKIND